MDEDIIVELDDWRRKLREWDQFPQGQDNAEPENLLEASYSCLIVQFKGSIVVRPNFGRRSQLDKEIYIVPTPCSGRVHQRL